MHMFAESVAARMNAVGLRGGELVSSTPTSSSFGDAEAVFRLGSLILHFVRDRGQEFLDIASAQAPDRFFVFDDIDIAMGWKTMDEIQAKQEPEALDTVLIRLAAHASELNAAFSGEHVRLTVAGIESVERERGQAFLQHLQSLQSKK